MDNEVCAYELCTCPVSDNAKYCSDPCRRSVLDNRPTPPGCRCRHDECEAATPEQVRAADQDEPGAAAG